MLKYFKIFIVLCLTIIVMQACDKPIEPEIIAGQGAQDLTENAVYFYETSGTQKLYKYLLDDNSLDSTILPYSSVNSITVSPDGNRIYLQSDNIKILSADTYSLIDEIAIHGQHRSIISPNGELLAMTGDTLYIVRLSDKQILYQNHSIKTLNGFFTSDNNQFYCSALDTAVSDYRYVFSLDLTTTPFNVSTKLFDNKNILSVKTTPDQSKWVVSASYFFMIYDPQLDTVLFMTNACPPDQQTVISSDGGKVYFTYPGNFNCTKDAYIDVFDIQANTFTERIDSVFVTDDTSMFFQVYDLSLTPDDQSLVFMAGFSNHELLEFNVIDLTQNTLQFRKRYWEEQYTLSNIAVPQK